MASSLLGVFYLDDPQDGVSDYLMNSIGVTLSRKKITVIFPDLAEEDINDVGKKVKTSPTSPPLEFELWHEHTYAVVVHVQCLYGVRLVDVRDSADAWIRIVLLEGDGLVLAAGAQHRIPNVGCKCVVMPVFETDCDRNSKASTVRFTAPVPDTLKAYGSFAISFVGTLPPVEPKYRFFSSNLEKSID